jgi:hypothetical protein
MQDIFKDGNEKFMIIIHSISNPEIELIGYVDSKWFTDQFEGEIPGPKWIIKDELESEFEEEVIEPMFSFYEENGDESNFDTGWWYSYTLR